MADSDASGVLDTRPALDRELALLRADSNLGVAEVVLSLDGAPLVLPFDAVQIAGVVDRAYRAGGFAALEMIHGAATRQLDQVEASLRARQEMAKAALDSVPESGYRGPAEDLLKERRYVVTLLDDERARRQDQLATLRDAIDRVAQIEEVAQRWYERKLLASIAADFVKRQADLERAWKSYKIGNAKTRLTVFLKDTVSAEGLAILATDDTATIVGGKASDRIQGAAEDITVPAVLKATYDLAVAEYEYKQALQGATRAAAIRGGPVNPADMPAWVQRDKYARLVAEHSEKHFVALPAHRGLIRVSREFAFNRQRYETAVIEAFLRARDKMPELQREMTANTLFTGNERAAAVGLDGLPRTAADVLIAERYRERADVVLVKPDPNKEAKTPEIYYSPWLQKPFRDRLVLLAAVLRIEEMQAAAKSALPPPVTMPGNTGQADAEPAAIDPKVLERMQRAVAHLRPLFREPVDRQQLLWCTSIGTLMSRAHHEVSERLEERVARLAAMRATVQKGVAVAGLVLIPFTGGKSIVVAGAIDAMLVADRTLDEVQKWIAADQFSRIALDQLASMHWREPETSMLVGQFLEAGYEIAGDLIQTGMAGKIFDMIGAADLLVTATDTSIQALTGGRR